MSEKTIHDLVSQEYKYGFRTEIESGKTIKGLTEETIRAISAYKKEPEFMLEFRLNAFRQWKKMSEPHWANVHHPEIDYQEIIYYAEPKQAKEKPKSLDEIDPELRKTFEKLGIPLMEQKRLTGVAVDAIFDSISVATTFKQKLLDIGVIFCPFSEAVQKYPELVLPNTTNSLDGSFSHLKNQVGLHRGKTATRRYKIIQEILRRRAG